jgi:ribokinase
MNKPSIVVVGSSNTDMIAKVRHLPRAGETVMGDEFLSEPGGKGANQAVAAARAGAAVSLVARVGRDTLGEQAIAAYTADGIDVTYVTRDRHRPSGAALIFVAADGANSIAVASGANGALSPSHVRKAASMIGNAKVLLLQLEIPIETVNAAARVAVAKGVRVILNPAPARRLSRQLLRQISILTPNESEAELLTGIRLRNLVAAEQAARKLVRLGARTVILTLGAKGALIASDGETELVPGFNVRAIDTTAAGDVFNGMLAVAVAEERPLIEAVRMANAAAALSVQCSGSQASAPSRRAINVFLRSQAGAHSPRR